MEEEQKSRIVIEFPEAGSVIFSIHLENIIPMQMVAVGEYLKHKGIIALEIQEQQLAQMQAKNKLAIPEKKILVAEK